MLSSVRRAQAAEKAPKRARGAPKPMAGKPPAAGRLRAAAARGSSASEDECAPRIRISLAFVSHPMDLTGLFYKVSML